jgi:hypothetical protein
MVDMATTASASDQTEPQPEPTIKIIWTLTEDHQASVTVTQLAKLLGVHRQRIFAAIADGKSLLDLNDGGIADRLAEIEGDDTFAGSVYRNDIQLQIRLQTTTEPTKIRKTCPVCQEVLAARGFGPHMEAHYRRGTPRPTTQVAP